MNRRNYLALMGAAAGAVATSKLMFPHKSPGPRIQARRQPPPWRIVSVA